MSVVVFALAWWLGLYLLARGPAKPVLCRAGVGLLGYAVAVAARELLDGAFADRVGLVLLAVPGVAWTGVVVRLLPGEHDRWWLRGVLPAYAVASAAVLGFGGGVTAGLLVAVVLAPLAAALGLLVLHRAALRPRAAGRLIVVATLLFGLGAVSLVLGLDVLPDALLLGMIGADLVLLGVTVAVFDAFDEGEALRADMARSFVVCAATAVLFGGQVGLALLLTESRPALVALLYGTLAAAIAIQVLARPLQTAADRVVFRPALTEARSELRRVADGLPRRDEDARVAGLDEEEFARLVRRALSNYGDLGKLVSSPLAGLPAIGERLVARGVADAPIARATELKALLRESVTRLKPSDGDFGTSEEWRYYNALHFYYVVGIRPYSVRTKRADVDPVSRKALAWFVDQVPERTLHNWQNAGAKLVAADLRATLLRAS
ncbi:hypothetical protein EV193_104270 [Herbihabitans rhizosphaerae]|uniref:Transmembrane protein n=1 Tax=Herbihabitans rhizosphaerae TaxID=1872711 RepID=A0A4Q7KQG7_9PSEU|nr:hypothetical protein [Herbihabitans rhizosphaerae]RZS39059.1 hypothetical protein EV193_104270 [Herbihabitans rhizosphaerae]